MAENHVHSDSNGSMGFFFGIVLLIVFGILFFIYGLPYIRNTFQGQQSPQAPQINIPNEIDVNINKK